MAKKRTGSVNKSLHLMTVVGARPQFIKVAPLSRAYAEMGIQETLVHTGQHYDDRMSDVFFREMHLPKADLHLEVGSGPHGKQTGDMLAKLEPEILRVRPDAVCVLGDTNSTIAGALSAAKLHVPVVHIEAGLRSFNRSMPEEINRVVTDHLSDVLICSSAVGKANLAREGIRRNVFVVGDVMVDALQHFRTEALSRNTLATQGVSRGEYAMLTIHRAENTASDETVAEIFRALSALRMPVLFPVHPRTRPIVERVLSGVPASNLRLLEPLGYLDMLALTEGSALVLTDSGGLQKEAFALSIPTITVRSETEWKETLRGGCNRLAAPTEKALRQSIAAILRRPPRFPRGKGPYGNGKAALATARILKRIFR